MSRVLVPGPGPRAWSWTDVWLVVVITAPLWIAPGSPNQPIATAYFTKALAALLLVLPWLALTPRTAPIPVRSTVPLLALAGAYAVAAIAHPPDRTAEVVDAMLRVALPLVALAIAGGAASPRVIFGAIVGSACLLAIFVIAEACGAPLSDGAQARPAVLLVHRNNVAFHLVAALPLVAAGLAHAKSRELRIAAILGIALLVAAIVIARSRGAWIAAVASLIPLACVLPRVLVLRLFAIVTAIVLAIGVWGAQAGFEPLADRVRGAFDPDGEAAWFERFSIYNHTLDRIAEHPLTGWGAGDFATRHTRFLDGRPADHPHDDLLTAGYEAGVIAALALALVLIVVPFRTTRRARRSRSPILAGFAGSLIAWGVLGLVNSPLSLAPSAVWFWLTVGAALATSTSEDTR